MEKGKRLTNNKENNKSNVWFSLRKSLHCKSEPSEVYDPIKTRKQKHDHNKMLLTRKVGRSGCSRSISNLKDVIHGSKRHAEKPQGCSPRSIGSSEFVNPITHQVVLSHTNKCELRICNGGGLSSFVGTLRPGTPGPGGYPAMHYFDGDKRGSSGGSAGAPLRKSFGLEKEGSSIYNNGGGVNGFSSRKKFAVEEIDSNALLSNIIRCHKCCEQFNKWDALQAHHLSNHAVTELAEGDSSRKIVEIICRTSWLKSENHCGSIERVLKVHNTQKTIARFEEYRDMVKAKASRLAKKHPRCIADGNELLRFYGTTLSCSLGLDGSSSLCLSEKCSVCRVIRHGFFSNKGGIGVFTTSTCEKAFENIRVDADDECLKKALIVCRVIAGRVHRPLENVHELVGQSGFDSVAGKVGLYSSIEELYLLNPRALLPCFVVICKP